MSKLIKYLSILTSTRINDHGRLRSVIVSERSALIDRKLMTRPRESDDRGEAADAPPSPRCSRNVRACIPGRNVVPGVAILGSQVGSRAVDAPWWSFCLLTALGLVAVCLRIVFPQDSPDKLTWWSERRRTKHRCPCQHLSGGVSFRSDAAGRRNCEARGGSRSRGRQASMPRRSTARSRRSAIAGSSTAAARRWCG
jgi:hypothetical protein